MIRTVVKQGIVVNEIVLAEQAKTQDINCRKYASPPTQHFIANF